MRGRTQADLSFFRLRSGSASPEGEQQILWNDTSENEMSYQFIKLGKFITIH